MKTKTFLAVCLLDFLAGDPHWLPHPVRLIGATISRGEKTIRLLTNSPTSEFFGGACLSIAVVGASYKSAAILIGQSEKLNANFGATTEIVLGWTTLAIRSLADETGVVLKSLEKKDFETARKDLSMIVGRDTENLDESEIARAVIETTAESLCDGIVAPLFYLAVGGVPLAFAYKAVNTLDSMIGHKENSYFYFGKFAARLDDAANYIPARLTAILIIAAAKIMRFDARSAVRVRRRDAHLHSSPNAGQSEAAMAGALNIKLGGTNSYDGNLHESAEFGAEYEAPDLKAARNSKRLTLCASLLACAGVAAFCWVKTGKKREKIRIDRERSN